MTTTPCATRDSTTNWIPKGLNNIFWHTLFFDGLAWLLVIKWYHYMLPKAPGFKKYCIIFMTFWCWNFLSVSRHFNFSSVRIMRQMSPIIVSKIPFVILGQYLAAKTTRDSKILDYIVLEYILFFVCVNGQ